MELLLWIFGLAVLLFILYRYIIPTYRNWRTKKIKLAELEDNCEKLKEMRNDLIVFL